MESSRRNSFYDPSDQDLRNNSPLRAYGRHSFDDTPRRPPHGASTFVAQKRQTAFASPATTGSIGRSGWKKAWGAEPPGWQSRPTHTTIEVLAISPVVDSPVNIRDVFSGRPSLSLNDESDWVDEDDDGIAYSGGLGQLPVSATSSNWKPSSAPSLISPTSASSTTSFSPTETTMALSAAPKGNNGRGSANSKKGRNSMPWSSGGTNNTKTRGKAAQPPVTRASPLPADSFTDVSDNRGTRRALPTARSNGPSAIQEEDEGEEE